MTRIQPLQPRRSPARRAAGPIASALLAGALAASPVAWAATKGAPPPELPAETLGVATLAGAPGERIYVADIAISHIVDGRIRVFGAGDGKLLGMLASGYAGNFALSAKSDELYIATTYLSRLGRGDRTDVLEVWDTTTLGFKYEVVIPSKRAQTLNYRGMVRPTGNGRFVLVQNATPATSITVVDLQQKKVASEIATPGCWTAMPSASGARFSMLCGDGKVATVTLDDNGQSADRQVSEKFFDADNDAWFQTSDSSGDRYWFVSFKGTLTELDLSGPVAKVTKSTKLVNAAQEKAGWRPGGYQPFAVDPSGRWLVVAMHAGGREGSHKSPAKELWTFDLSSGKRVATAPGRGTVSLAFSKSGKRLQALDGATGALNVWAWNGGKMKHTTTVARAGEAALHLESHD